MQRSQRGIDNSALNVAVEAANVLHKPVVVFFAPRPFGAANLRHYAFLARGIPDIAEALAKRNVGLVLRQFPEHSLLRFCDEARPSLVIGDENPIREAEGWRQIVAKRLKVPFWTVDADVIVPSKLLAKEQYAAFILRRRLQEHLPRFLVAPGNPRAKVRWQRPRSLYSLPSALDITEGWDLDRSVQPVSDWKGGSTEALRALRAFLRHRLTVALAIQKADAPMADKQAFLDQLITWRELAVNFVRFNADYDNFESAEPWAHRSLAKHARDLRPVLYTEKQLENAETHDPLWNAAQMQMVNTGWMHNYVRMYWGKKILEWSRSSSAAYQIAVRLNDKYELDGRDPNGYAGIAWCIVGKFDRPWFQRPIFGQIRYMSGASTGRKFDSKKYIETNLNTADAAD
jgi:deoxyribodipyrimidine photo-lyase